MEFANYRKILDTLTEPSAGGGIGRRAGFRSLCPLGCVGSSPTRRTQIIKYGVDK